VFFFFANFDFDILSLFKKHLLILSIVLLILPLVIGQITRGAIRWIPIGALTLQPAEIVRPFLILYFANYLTEAKINTKRLLNIFLSFSVPLILIIIQPSLGVSVLTLVAFIGVLLASGIEKKYYLYGAAILGLLLPISWNFMKDYQRARIVAFVTPSQDPLGAGYNSIQSVISVGSGKLFGRGLGKGVQTQLSFLPERHTDFIFASVAEELGFLGSIFLLTLTFYLMLRLIEILEKSASPAGRAYVSGFFLATLAQVVVHIGMNLGLLPITGIPYPLVSAGGSSLLATMTGLGIAISTQKNI